MFLQPTMHHGNWCSIAEFVANNVTAWIGRCQYDLAYETLEHIYGNLKVIRTIQTD